MLPRTRSVFVQDADRMQALPARCDEIRQDLQVWVTDDQRIYSCGRLAPSSAEKLYTTLLTVHEAVNTAGLAQITLQ